VSGRPANRLILVGVLSLGLLGGCMTVPRPPIATVANLDVERFMGDWYVIASVPTRLESNAYNLVEHYELGADGRIGTTITFREGGFDGSVVTRHAKGYVEDWVHHSSWALESIPPVKSELLIAEVDVGYRQAILARTARDHVWIVARTPTIPDADYARLVGDVQAMGYDVDRLRRMPQHW
jgi:apolipoprotein D and lipocalin family protein